MTVTATASAARSEYLGRGGPDRVWSLVDDAKAGDRRALARLYELHVGEVFRFVLARTGNYHVAEDVTSETFVRALRKLGTISHRRSTFRAWLMTIARNLVIDDATSARRRVEVTMPESVDGPSEHIGPEAAAVRRADAAELCGLLAELSPDQRACLELRFLHDLPVAEVARRMRRRTGAVRAVQVRALRKLGELMTPEPQSLAS